MSLNLALDNIQAKFDVSRETMDRLCIYHDLLHKWQKAINLVSGSTLNDTWGRHFVDSMQLAQYIAPHIKTLADIGSGAGFPGMVLAIMRPNIQVHLIESDERKSQFLRTVSREAGVAVHVHARRIEDITSDVVPDLVTARALASLPQLFDYCAPWVNANSALEMLFLKGKTAQEEIDEAQNNHQFSVQTYASCTDDLAQIVHVKDVQLRT